MHGNKVWNLVELSQGSKQVRCKWVFKTKHDSKGNIEWYKTRHVVKVLLKKWALSVMKPSLQFQRGIH